MDINLVNAGLTIAGVLIANYGIKLGKAYGIIKEGYELLQGQIDARANGVLTVKEKANLYDDIEEVLTEAWSVLKGFFPNRSK